MKQKIKNQIILLTGLFLLILQFANAVLTMSEAPRFDKIWIIAIYLYVLLFIGGLLLYLVHTIGSKTTQNDKRHIEKNTIALFLGIVLFSSLYLGFMKFVIDYYLFYIGAGTIKLYQIFSYLVYISILLCCIPGLLVPLKIGYILCMQLPFYFISQFFRNPDLFFITQSMWCYVLMFVFVWSILCHQRKMLDHWKIQSRKELALYLGLAVTIGFIIHYSRIILCDTYGIC